MFESHILSLGSAFPEEVLHSNQFLDRSGVNESWIVERTGILERRVLKNSEKNVDLAVSACNMALDRAQMSIADIDLILGCTNSPDKWMPGLAPSILNSLATKKNAAAFDVVSACSGWLAGLQCADAFIRTGKYKNILVVGSESFSRFLNWSDPTTCVLFGDGAGAAVVSSKGKSGTIIDNILCSDGGQGDILELYSRGKWYPLGAAESIPTKEIDLKMNGEKLFVQAVRLMASSCNELLRRNNLSVDDVRWLIPHQANLWIINVMGEKLGISKERVGINIERFGNTIAATIPTCFEQYVNSGQVKTNDIVLLTTFGAGTTWGATLLRW